MKRRTCPKCKSTNVAVILYGYPMNMDSLSKDLEDGKIVLGGCDISDDDPKWFCNICHNEFGNRFVTLGEM